MKTESLSPAEFRFGDPSNGGQVQARHVFLAGNGLPGRWQGRRCFTVLETGFGLGHNFLATWAAWHADPQRCSQLIFISVEQHPLRLADLVQAHAASTLPELATALQSQWPPLAHGLHTLEFAQGQVRLLLALGDMARWLPELTATVDAFFLGGFAPALNPKMESPRVFKACARLAGPGATLASSHTSPDLRAGLRTAGFDVQSDPGLEAGHEIGLAQLQADAPGLRRAPPPGRRSQPEARDALVIGAGLAGAAAARALARDGLRVTVLERHNAAAQETSGNPAGLFHGVLHPNDGAHAQLLRAAALRAQQCLAPLVVSGAVPGQVAGLLRGNGTKPLALSAMQALLDRAGLPAEFVQALSHDQAGALADVPLTGDQWCYPGGGWVSPPALVGHWLRGDSVHLHTGEAVDRLAHDAPRRRWQALAADGRLIAEAEVLVLASAHDTPRLLQGWTDTAAWPLVRRRGQITQVPPALAHSAHLPRPARPLASGGYLISLPATLGGGLLCGATSTADDEDGQLRTADHRHNLAQIRALTGHTVSLGDEEMVHLAGRVGWRLACDDRLPLVGAVPAMAHPQQGLQRQEQPRHVPRVDGLYVLTALGSRGITLAPLLGELLAAWITGSPLPLASSLVDAIDPARFVSRALRRDA